MNRKHPLILAALLSMPIHSVWALEPVKTTNVKLVNPALIKRDVLEVDEVDFSPAQKLKIQNVMQDLDAQVKNAFKGDEALQAEMSGELKKISAIKDDTVRSSAIKAYQAKYGKRYQAILTKGNVNLSTFASRLNADLPDMQFDVTNNLSIKGEAKTMQTQSTSNAQAQSNAGVKEVELAMSDYVPSITNEGCTPRSTANNVNAFWAVADNSDDSCDVLIEKSGRIVVPKRTKVTITIKADLYTKIHAESNMYGYALAKIPVASGPKVEAKSVLTVPFNWSDEANSDAPNKLVIKSYTNNSNSEEIIERKLLKLKAKKSLGFGGSGSSIAHTGNFSVKVKFEPL